MNSPTRRRCAHCRQLFAPDYRNTYHQRFCSAPACQHASKQTSQRRWLRKPENRDYFREPDNLRRVRDWRILHPGYWRALKHRCRSIGEPSQAGSLGRDSTTDPSAQTGTLQDFCRSKAFVLTGLLSRLRRCALQEDMARYAIQVVSEAQCILQQCQLAVPLSAPPLGEVNFHESG
jgi:hypothetical protein